MEVEDEMEWFAQWMYEWGWQMYLDQLADIEQIWNKRSQSAGEVEDQEE